MVTTNQHVVHKFLYLMGLQSAMVDQYQYEYIDCLPFLMVQTYFAAPTTHPPTHHNHMVEKWRDELKEGASYIKQSFEVETCALINFSYCEYDPLQSVTLSKRMFVGNSLVDDSM
ncbi:hypothetical protein VNO78_14973 [Psophocarpus tetragonolobus]|uniref:Uncharacterized protein n=1 Tax=Psophocarpus tetragonolobus TaxID=3891 RepID=A0AAN9SE75_PSOTE